MRHALENSLRQEENRAIGRSSLVTAAVAFAAAGLVGLDPITCGLAIGGLAWVGQKTRQTLRR